MNKSWSSKDLQKLYDLKVNKGEKWSKIAKVMKRSTGAIRQKYRRTNWDVFVDNPSNYIKIEQQAHKWSHDEMVKLEAYLQTGTCDYDFMAEQLGRSVTSVERKAQETDWEAWRTIEEARSMDDDYVDPDNEILIDKLAYALIRLARRDVDKLNSISEQSFLERSGFDGALPISYDDVKQKAEEELKTLGFSNPETVKYGKGRYVIVGDSHGKHTKKGVFKLLRQINKALSPDRIIHVGHLIDDDDDISYEWGSLDNLSVIAKIEELKTIQAQRNKFNFNYEIIRGAINLGSLMIMNQDMIRDYVKTPLKSLDSEIFDPMVVVNSHRHEFFSRCISEGASYIASPGCLCEQHIVRTIKQMDFTDGRHVKQAFHESFAKYRRNLHMCKYWEQGLIVVDVDSKGNHTLIPCRIKELSKGGYATSYFDKIITSKGVRKPTKKIFVNGDLHSNQHDAKVLDIQESICKDYKPDIHVNVGDTHNYSALNHHIMDRGGVINDKKLLDEASQTNHILKQIRKWADESYLIYGNHERFAKDFVMKFPQFGDYLDFRFLCSLDDLGYRLIKLKDVLELGDTKFIHGEIKMYGQSGSVLEKAARTFGDSVFIGHIHYPAIRFGCYSIGLSGQMNQGYNEEKASAWMHGFGLCNHYDKQSWLTTVGIVNNKCLINGKTYKPTSKYHKWKSTNYSAKIVYETT